MLCCVEHQLFLSHGLRSAPGDNYVPQHFACLQSSTVGSSNEEGLSDKERLMLQLESGQVYTEGIRVRRRRPCIESTVAVLLQGKQESRGRTHTHKFHICKYIHINSVQQIMPVDGWKLAQRSVGQGYSSIFDKEIAPED